MLIHLSTSSVADVKCQEESLLSIVYVMFVSMLVLGHDFQHQSVRNVEYSALAVLAGSNIDYRRGAEGQQRPCHTPSSSKSYHLGALGKPKTTCVVPPMERSQTVYKYVKHRCKVLAPRVPVKNDWPPMISPLIHQLCLSRQDTYIFNGTASVKPSIPNAVGGDGFRKSDRHLSFRCSNSCCSTSPQGCFGFHGFRFESDAAGYLV